MGQWKAQKLDHFSKRFKGLFANGNDTQLQHRLLHETWDAVETEILCTLFHVREQFQRVMRLAM
ncbi:hypothetical protein BCR43DRAFT_513302 [Syncephalastrum racemosum]|uniref:Uncharacterized protein n=1 Tax=Syncephalastrum racemosum TaxID=13706 RepID=A0A1X2HKP8_SYNRA|nr:hypothetical protein BCR43DRAFT_513302 [Syncephalastrum racemosum]